MVQPLLWQSVSSFDPHLLVVDTFPGGPEEELVPLMRWPIRKAFVYRDSKYGSNENPAFRKALEPYQLILVAHAKGTVGLPPALAGDARVHFTGVISEGGAEPDEKNTREELRKRLGLGTEQTALITLGGGGDPAAKKLLPVIVKWFRKKEIPFFVATGPLTRDFPDCITAREWLPVWPLSPWLPAFDLAVASGGYNTVAELRSSGVPSLLIPFARELDDQEKRVSEAAREGWAIRAETGVRDTLDGRLEQLFLLVKNRQRTEQRPGDQGLLPNESRHPGADRAAELLLTLLSGTPSYRVTEPLSPSSDREVPRVSSH
jgi:UDP:flavonoid glycosyltransferase YjiC (YdhE family)